ncbi:MAG: hypothetical protein IJT42_04095 [Treponema sp.]|nr:hypothetical protein [Treponema sp.]
MEKEMKIVTRQETFTDLAVRELGKSRAACVCRLQFKRCKKSECASCPQHKKFQSCVEVMSDYDRLRLDSYTAGYYVEYSSNPMAWMNHREYVWHFTKFMSALIGGMVIFFAALIFLTGL